MVCGRLYAPLLSVLWRCGVRSGTIRAFDVEDYDRENEWLRAVHREGTPLKNKERRERLIALSLDTCQVLNDYVDHTRHDVTGKVERNPLFATQFSWRKQEVFGHRIKRSGFSAASQNVQKF
ncbi:site-specific integrase [Halomarina pelagica]|uniref:site-specific integrase n=1 Tax=Halomarina pelagica TaxID=2961599 RepID=UPI0020C36BD7|nr:site-specific integrase [Halomarina sp. BND7]